MSGLFSFSCSTFSCSSANEENVLQYLAFLQVLLATLRIMPSRGKQGSGRWFGGGKGRPTLCHVGPSSGRPAVLGGRDGTDDIQQLNQRKVQPEKKKVGRFLLLDPI